MAEKVKKWFRDELGQFREEDFVAVADYLGFDAYRKTEPGKQLKPVAENYFPDIIGRNLRYAVETFEWEAHIPMTDDGLIVSGFWDGSEGEDIPDGYEIASKGRFLIRKNAIGRSR